jgi:SAM-dependent methyltransferase
MNDIVNNNRLAWEASFEHRSEAFEARTIHLLTTNPKALFSKELATWLEKTAPNGKTLGQFCSNNGRETMGSLAFGFARAVGFDIASNMVAYGNQLAKQLNINAAFVATEILTIPETFQNTFDVGLITVGALCWFADLQPFFHAVRKTMKQGGTLLIEEMHPFGNMLAATDEPAFNPDHPTEVAYSYFKKEPWTSNEGMTYMTGETYQTTLFSSYSHPLSEIINAIVEAGFAIEQLQESDIDDADLFAHLSGKGMPFTLRIKALAR